VAGAGARFNQLSLGSVPRRRSAQRHRQATPLAASWTRTRYGAPTLGTPSCSVGTPPLAPGAGLGGRTAGTCHRPGWTDVSAARHDRAAWQVKLLVDHRERLVAERPWTSNRLGWQLHQLDLTWNRRPGPSQRHSTAWLARAAPRRRPGLYELSGPGRRDWLPDRPARPTRPRALPSCHSVGPEPARVAWWWAADRRQVKLIADSAGVARSPSAPAAPIASACRGWQPAAACRPAPYRDHPAAPARPRQTHDQRRRAQGDATGEAVPAPSGAATPEPSTGTSSRPNNHPPPQPRPGRGATYPEGGPLMYDMVLTRTLAPTDRPRA
jgi:hypothetical protein